MARRVNAETLALVKNHEGLRLKAYADPGYGWDLATIGYGHTSDPHFPVKRGTTITEEQAEDLLAHDLEEAGAIVEKLVKVPLNDNQFGALASFAFNVRPDLFKASTLLKKVNSGDFDGAAAEFSRWVYSNGQKLAGLKKRRADEAALFSKPVAVALAPTPMPKQVPVAPAPAARAAGGFKAFLLFILSLFKKGLRP